MHPGCLSEGLVLLQLAAEARDGLSSPGSLSRVVFLSYKNSKFNFSEDWEE